MNWYQLIKERNEWVAHNFPNQQGNADSTFGVIEELGELTHHYLKDKQGIRGTHQDHVDEMQDAIGDLTVYLWGVMNLHRVLEVNKERPRRKTLDVEVVLRNLASAVGDLAVAEERGVTTWSMKHLITRVVAGCEDFCELQGWDYESIVRTTWEAVKERDWIKYPKTGLPEVITDGHTTGNKIVQEMDEARARRALKGTPVADNPHVDWDDR